MRALPVPRLRDPESLIVQQAQPVVAARVAPEPVQAALGETERLPKQQDDLLAGLLASEPPKQEAAKATIASDGHTINVYASASAEQPTKQATRKGGATNMRRRVVNLKNARQSESFEQVYARLTHLKFDDAWEAAGKLPGDRNKAHALWKTARDAIKSTTKP